MSPFEQDDQRDDSSNRLTDDRGQCSPGYRQTREGPPTEDHERVQDDIGNDGHNAYEHGRDRVTICCHDLGIGDGHELEGHPDEDDARIDRTGTSDSRVRGEKPQEDRREDDTRHHYE